MQSRISFFDKTVFRKNLTRFAPAWGLYTLCMLLGLVLMMDGSGWLARNLMECVQIMSIITPCYALLVAQLLFGDLYNSRMCNALHALPLRRETWYFTHVASGFVFHLIPTGIMAVLATVILVLSGYESAWSAGLYWFLGVNLQFAGFFGLAVFSVFCVGSRFAMAVVYGILNFAAIIGAWLISELYVPLYYGIKMDYSGISMFSPVYQMIQSGFAYVHQYGPWAYESPRPGDNWWYYWAYAAVGCALIVAAVQMYRKRRLECAGDFMAIKGLEPVFHVVYSLIVGAVFAFVFDEIFGMHNGWLFLFVGIAVGYFTGRMLLERNIRVFQMRQWVKCGALLITFALTLLVAALDPFGIDDWMPKAENVKSVTIATGHYTYHECERTLTEQADIETVLALHADALEQKGVVEYAAVEPVATEVPVDMAATMPAIETVAVETRDNTETTVETVEELNTGVDITIAYHLKDGRTVSRYYTYWTGTKQGNILNGYFSTALCLFGEELTARELAERYTYTDMSPNIGEQQTYKGEETMEGLFEAILKDCEAGHMVQSWDFHGNAGRNLVCWLTFWDKDEVLEINVFSDAEHTIQWLQDNGYDWEYYYETYYEE